MGVLEWRPVIDYEGLYSVSNTGLIYSYLTEKVLKPNEMNTGYLTVELFKNGHSKRVLIHRLVAGSFIPNPFNFPVVNHKDEDKRNNAVSNLEWCTQKYNANYGNALIKKKQNRVVTDAVKKSLLMGSVSRKIRVLQFDKNGEFIRSFNCIADAERELKINASHISETCKQKRKSAGGYIWQYERSVDLSES